MSETVTLACNEVWGGNGATREPLSLPGIEGHVYSLPYRDEAAGGDLHYVSSCGTGRITRVMLADVMGHGESASDVAGYLRSLMRRYLNHIEPHNLAAEVSRLLHSEPAGGGRFATSVILTFFAPTGELSLCNAGHPAPVLYRKGEGRWHLLPRRSDQPYPTNLPLGVDVEEGGGYDEQVLGLDPGDAVVLYTDGLIEASGSDGEQLGTERLLEILRSLGTPSSWAESGKLSERVLESARSQGYSLEGDDVSIVLLRCVGRSNGAGMRDRLTAMVRTLRGIGRGAPIPWPEVSVRNLLGGVIPGMSRVKPRKGG
jgi:phosphoserine phosphatase RsbU/P